MSIQLMSLRPDADGGAALGSRRGARRAVVAALWFGMVAGWLELGLTAARGFIHPFASFDTIRTNRQWVWMIPASDVLIFGLVGLLIGALALVWQRAARWLGARLPVALAFWALLLNLEGLHAFAGAILACGFASIIGSWLERKSPGFDRVVKASLPALALSLVMLTAAWSAWVVTAEKRAFALAPPAKPGAPNVLMIVLDTVRAANLSLHGHYRPTTPNLERLARDGVVFTEARSTAPWTTPTHATLMTGRWPHELSASPTTPLDGTYPTLAEVLGREGYATAGFVGNIYYCNAVFGLGRGFARYEDAYENQTVSFFETVWSSGLGKRACRSLGISTQLDDGVSLRRKSAPMLDRDLLGWLDGRPADRPFFAFVNYYDAHRPYVLPGDRAFRFGAAAAPRDRRLEIEKRYLDLAGGAPAATPEEFQQVSLNAVELYQDSYDSCIAALDHWIGVLVDELKRRGLMENTLVIVTSDHGEEFGERGWITHGASLYRPEVHVPLLVIPPAGAARHKIVNRPVSLREIPATVAQWVDLGSRNPFPGRSLTRFLDENRVRQPHKSPVLCELEHNMAFPDRKTMPPPMGLSTSLVSRDRVYIRKDDGAEELYDLQNDPLERVDLAKFPESRLAIDAFRRQLIQLRPDPTRARRPAAAP